MENKRKCEDHSLGNNFLSTINSVNVQSLRIENNQVFVCSKEDHLVDVWKGLSKHHFSSVPVLQKTKNKYYGVIDIHDIMNFVLEFFGNEELNTIDNFWKIVEKSEKLKTVTINNVLHYPRSRINPFNPVKVGFSLHYAMELFAKEEKLQRIPIITKENQLYSVLTISRVVQYLYEHKSLLGNRITKPIELLGGAHSGVFSIKSTDKAINAFKLMREKDLNCIAVENAEGSLVGVISQSDIKTISSDGSLFYKLFLDATTFIQNINPNKGKIEIISCIPSDNLGSVIDSLHLNKLHQIFVINNKNERKALGIITLKDIIKDILCH